jgi:hypothetical protein
MISDAAHPRWDLVSVEFVTNAWKVPFDHRLPPLIQDGRHLGFSFH